MKQDHTYNRLIKPATSYTVERNHSTAERLGLDINNNTTDELELAADRCIYPADDLEIIADDGHVVWSVKAHSYYNEKATPDTIYYQSW